MFKKSLSQHMTVKAKTRQIVAGVVFGIAIYVVNVNSGVLMGNAADFALAARVIPDGESTNTVSIPDMSFALFSVRQAAVDMPLLGAMSLIRFNVSKPMFLAMLMRWRKGGLVTLKTQPEASPTLALLAHTFSMNSLTRATVDLPGSDVIAAISAFATEPTEDLINRISMDAQLAGNSGSVFESHEGPEDQLGINRCAFRQGNLLVGGAGRLLKCNMNRS